MVVCCSGFVDKIQPFHRSVSSHFQALKAEPSHKDLEAQAAKCNDRKWAAKDAQEASDNIFLCLYLKDHPTELTGKKK